MSPFWLLSGPSRPALPSSTSLTFALTAPTAPVPLARSYGIMASSYLWMSAFCLLSGIVLVAFKPTVDAFEGQQGESYFRFAIEFHGE